MSDDSLLVRYEDSVLTLTVNRPEKRHALSLVLLDRIADTLKAHQDEAELRCVVITAAGDQAFAAPSSFHRARPGSDKKPPLVPGQRRVP